MKEKVNIDLLELNRNDLPPKNLYANDQIHEFHALEMKSVPTNHVSHTMFVCFAIVTEPTKQNA